MNTIFFFPPSAARAAEPQNLPTHTTNASIKIRFIKSSR
jgi:hypothetical protein